MQNFRNLPTERAENLARLVPILPGRVVSMALSQSERCQMTLLAFADGESVSEERYFGDTFYYVLEGEMPLRREGQTECLLTGDCIAVPAGTLHAIGGTRPFKVLQITIQ